MENATGLLSLVIHHAIHQSDRILWLHVGYNEMRRDASTTLFFSFVNNFYDNMEMHYLVQTHEEPSQSSKRWYKEV